MVTRNFTFRLTAEGVAKLEAELKALGPAGETAFNRLKESGPLVGNAFDRATAAAKRTREELERNAQSGASKAIAGAMGEISGKAEALTGRLGVVGGALRAIGPAGLAAGAGVAAVGLGLLSIARAGDSLKPIEGQLRNVTGSAAAAQAAFRALFDQAQRVGAPLAETANTFARYARAAEELGESRDNVLRFAETVQKLAVVGGAATSEAAAGALQLAQGLASGRLQGDELRSVLENMPPVAKAIAKELGVSVGQLREMGAAGQLTARTVFPALLKASAEADKQFGEIPKTIERTEQAFRNQLQVTLAGFDRMTGASDAYNASLEAGRKILAGVAVRDAPTTGQQIGEAGARLNQLYARPGGSGPIGFLGRLIQNTPGEIAALEKQRELLQDIAKEEAGLANSRVLQDRARAMDALSDSAKVLLDSYDEEEAARTKLIATGTALAESYKAISLAAAAAGGPTLEQAAILARLQQAAGSLTVELDNLNQKGREYIVQARLQAEAAERLARVRPGDDRGAIRAGIENEVRAKGAALANDPRLAGNLAEQNKQLAEYRGYLERVAEAQRQGKIAAENYQAVQAAGAREAEQLADAEAKAAEELRQWREEQARILSDYKTSTKELQAQAEVAGRLPVVWDSVSEAYRVNDRELRILIETQRLNKQLVEAAPEEVRKLAEANVDAAQKIEEASRLNDRFIRDAERNRELWLEPFKNAIAGVQRSFVDLFKSIGKGGVDSFKDLAVKVKDVFIDLAAEIAALLVFRPVVGGVLGSIGLGGVAQQMGLGGGGANAATLGGSLARSGSGGFQVPGLPGGNVLSDWVRDINAWVSGGAALPASGFEFQSFTGAGQAAAAEAAMGLGLGDLLGIGGGILSIGLPLLQGNYASAGLGALGGGIGALLGGPAGFGLGAGLGSLLGGLFGFGKKKIPKATAYYGPVEGDYALLGSEVKKNGPLGATTGAGDYTADLLSRFIGGAGLEINDPSLGFYLRGKGNGRAFGGLYNPVSGQIEREYTASDTGDFERVAQSVVLFTLKEAIERGTLSGDARVVEAAKRSLAGPEGDWQKVVNNQGDLGETLQGVLGDIDFAKDFDLAIASLQGGILDFTQAIGVQARQEVEAATKAVAEFKDKTKELGLPVEEAAAATKSYVEILFGVKEAAEPLSEVAQALAALKSKYDNAKGILEEVGIDIATIPQLYQDALAKLRGEYNDSIAEQIRAFTDPYGLAMEKLKEQQAQQLKDAELIGGDIVELKRLHLLQEQAAVEQATGGALNGIRQFLLGLDQGSLSPLSPAAKLEEAGFAFNQANNAARGGDLAALAQLTSLASPYLTAAQSFYGGNEQYALIYETVRAALSNTAGHYETGNAVATAVTQGAQATVNELSALRDENRQLRTQVADLVSETAGLRADLNRFLTQATGTYR